MYNIAVIDDEKSFRDTIQNYLERAAAENSLPPYRYYLFDNAYDYIENNIYFDLVLLDIQMPLFNGFEAAKKIRERGDSTVIIFLTSFAQYAIKGYEVEAYDFILKPIKYGEFLYRLKKALSKLNTGAEKGLFIKYKGRQICIKISDILYIESLSHLCVVHTVRESYETRESLIKIEARLEGMGFERCNYSCLVNLHNVEKVEGDQVCLGGTSIFFSRNRKKHFIERYTEINRQ